MGVVIDDQLDGNPGKQQAADQFDIGQGQELHDHQRENNAQGNGGTGPQQNAGLALVLGQATAGERNDNRIIARQKQIDPDDLSDFQQQGRKFSVHEGHAFVRAE